MSEEIKHLYAPNLLSICIDRTSDGDYSGQAWDQYHTEPTAFGSMMELIRHVEDFFDELNFPQRSTVPRSFDSKEHSNTVFFRKRKEREKVMNMDSLEAKRGDQGTFIVQIKYRQNATWQGQVVWAEKNKKMYFRSALELLHLIDSAMSEKDQNDTLPAEPQGSTNPESETGSPTSPEST